MPSGKAHDRITVVTAIAAVPAWCHYAPPNSIAQGAVALAAYVFSGFWLSGDLDTNSIAYKRWGALRVLWWPYRKLVPHRSWVSHGLGIGPLLRAVYFVAVMWLATQLAAYALGREGIHVNGDILLLNLWHHTLHWTLTHPSYALCGVLGLVLGGVTHTVADITVTRLRRL